MVAAKKRAPLLSRIVDRVRRRTKSVLKLITYKCILPLLYRWWSRKPIDEKLVLFADHRDRPTPDNFLPMIELCEKNGYRCVVLSGRPFSDKLPRWTRRPAKVKFQFQFVKLLARSRALFLYDGFPLAFVVQPRPETTVVQLWHGCGAMKMFGYSTLDKAWRGVTKLYPAHNIYALACVSGPKAVGPFEEAFRSKPGVVQAIGCPRTDVYFDQKARAAMGKKLRKKFPQLQGKRVVLYAPTFRGNSIAKSHMKLNLVFRQILAQLPDDYVFLVKLHPLTAKSDGISELDRIACPGRLFDVSKTLTAEEALCAADILIADYSSILFEYLLLERPIISYIYDIDEYIRDRGLYFPYEQLSPGPYVSTQEELVEKLRTVDEWFDIERTRRYKEEWMSACDGHSTQRVFEAVFGAAPGSGKGEGES